MEWRRQDLHPRPAATQAEVDGFVTHAQFSGPLPNRPAPVFNPARRRRGLNALPREDEPMDRREAALAHVRQPTTTLRADADVVLDLKNDAVITSRTPSSRRAVSSGDCGGGGPRPGPQAADMRLRILVPGPFGRIRKFGVDRPLAARAEQG